MSRQLSEGERNSFEQSWNFTKQFSGRLVQSKRPNLLPTICPCGVTLKNKSLKEHQLQRTHIQKMYKLRLSIEQGGPQSLICCSGCNMYINRSQTSHSESSIHRLYKQNRLKNFPKCIQCHLHFKGPLQLHISNAIHHQNASRKQLYNVQQSVLKDEANCFQAHKQQFQKETIEVSNKIEQKLQKTLVKNKQSILENFDKQKKQMETQLEKQKTKDDNQYIEKIQQQKDKQEKPYKQIKNRYQQIESDQNNNHEDEDELNDFKLDKIVKKDKSKKKFDKMNATEKVEINQIKFAKDTFNERRKKRDPVSDNKLEQMFKQKVDPLKTRDIRTFFRNNSTEYKNSKNQEKQSYVDDQSQDLTATKDENQLKKIKVTQLFSNDENSSSSMIINVVGGKRNLNDSNQLMEIDVVGGNRNLNDSNQLMEIDVVGGKRNLNDLGIDFGQDQQANKKKK